MIYLTNKELLKEIHLSKNTFCSYVDEGSEHYDLIVPSLDRINRLTISQAKKNRAQRLNDLKTDGKRSKKALEALEAELVDPKKVKNTEVVFRVMTWDHVPLAPGRKKSPKLTSDHYVKLNFPPFQHYMLDEDGKPYVVGKSHWKGGMENGHFCKDKGRITSNLARMFIKLCERYSSRSNWRGYTYVDEMRGQALLQLSMIGLQFDESKSQNPFAYYTAAITNSFTRVLNLEKRTQHIRDDILEMNNLNPSFTRQMANEELMRELRDKNNATTTTTTDSEE
jgi:hypothetical protein